MNKFLTMLTVVVSLFTTALQAGTGTYDEETKTLTIGGSTDIEQYVSSLGLIRKHSNSIEEVVMYGGGGSARYMVILMKEINTLDVPVVIPRGKICASACALIATSSDKVLVKGTLLFHMGYTSTYPMGVTLHDILQYGQSMSIDISRVFQQVGFKQAFLEKLIKYTGPSTWYVVTNYGQIKSCKTKDDTVKDYMSSCYLSAPIRETKDILGSYSAPQKPH